jgi:hypothetical protein
METIPSPTELAWAAGFFDGDGYIGLATGLQVELTQKFRLPLDHFQKLFENGVFYHSHPKFEAITRRVPLWQLHYNGAAGARVLTALQPYLVGKQPEAILALQCYTACYANRPRGGKGRTPVERAEVDSFRKALVAYRHRPIEDCGLEA